MADPPIDDDGGPSLNNEDRTNTDSDKQQGKESGNNSEEPPGQTKQHEWEDLKDEEEAEGGEVSGQQLVEVAALHGQLDDKASV